MSSTSKHQSLANVRLADFDATVLAFVDDLRRLAT